MGKYFGTDGFRGEAGITLTADHAYKVGRFLGGYYNALRERDEETMCPWRRGWMWISRETWRKVLL